MNSKRMRFLTLSIALAAWWAMPNARAADTPKEGIALAIVYDTSGSMRETVRDKAGNQTSKYLIANRALKTVAAQIETFAAAQTNLEVIAALFTFKGGSASPVVPLAVFDRSTFDRFAASFSSPNGNTPLGDSLKVAWDTVLGAAAGRKHVLVITDGVNTEGPDPAQVLPRLKQAATEKGKTVAVHFVAFNVAAKEFNGVKKLGATVVAANDEKQLDTQLDFILQKKILLEDEEK